MSGSGQVRMSRRYISLIQLLNKRVNHFPAHEQKGLALVIRQKGYLLCDHMVEAQQRFHKKTPLNNLDITHEQLRMHLQLELSRSTIATTRKGVNFVGYRTWASSRYIRKHSLYKTRKAIREGRLESVISHLAHASKTHSLQHLLDYALEHNHALYRALPKIYHQRHIPPAQRTGRRHRAVHPERLDIRKPA